MRLSDRLRANVECAPWVVAEVLKLEQELVDVRLQVIKNAIVRVNAGDDCGCGAPCDCFSAGSAIGVLNQMADEIEGGSK